MTITIPTTPLHGYQVIFSPYSPRKIAFTGAQNFGIAGVGGLVLYEQEEEGLGYREVRRYGWRDGLFDVTWSEVNEAILVAGAGDGSLVIFDQNIADRPAAVLPGHTAEISSVHWNVNRQEQFVLSSSWDSTVRLWDPQRQSCLSTFTDHSGIVYTASWSPLLPHTFASVSGDETLRLWDSTHPPHSVSYIHAHRGEVLSCDWSKYDQHTLFTSGVDATIRCWDIRRLSSPVTSFMGHTQTIRRVKCDPFHGNIVASCSYDFTVRIWDVSRPVSPLVETVNHHREFTFGMDICSLEEGKMADCSWDCTTKIYHPASIAPKPKLPA